MAKLSEIDAALLVRLSPDLLRWFTANPAKALDPQKPKLEFAEGRHGDYLYDEAKLLAFDEYLREPWPHQPGKRPHVPEAIRNEVKLEAHCECAVCHKPNNGEAAHIKAVASSFDNHPHNLLWTCPSDHTRYDLGHKVHADLKQEMVRAVKARLLDSQMRIWRIEKRASERVEDVVLSLVKDVEELRAQIKETKDKTLKQALSGHAAALLGDVRVKTALLVSSKPKASKATPATNLGNTLLVSIPAKRAPGAPVDKTFKKVVSAKHEFLLATNEVECPLCEGNGRYDENDCPVCSGEGVLDRDRASEVDLSDYRLVDCPACKGRGRFGNYDECPGCGGDGKVQRRHEDRIRDDLRTLPCPLCRGKGAFRNYDDCPVCDGSKVIEERHMARVDLTPFDLVKCPRCRGRDGDCPSCDGTGTTERQFAERFESD